LFKITQLLIFLATAIEERVAERGGPIFGAKLITADIKYVILLTFFNMISLLELYILFREYLMPLSDLNAFNAYSLVNTDAFEVKTAELFTPAES